MIKGIRTPDEYWEELIESWPKDAPSGYVQGCKQSFLAGIVVCSSIMADLRLAKNMTPGEMSALYTFFIEEAMRNSTVVAKGPIFVVSEETGAKTRWEP